MEKSGQSELGGKWEFAKTEIGLTHFVDGEGTRKNPYESLADTLLDEVLIDAQGISNVRGKEVFLAHNKNLISVDKYMNVGLVAAAPDDKDFLHLLNETAEELRKKGIRALTNEELTKFQEELAEQQKERAKHQETDDLIDKIFKKLGL